MSANPFDQFDSGGIASAPKTSNPFDKFDPAPPEPGLLETAARTIGSGATRALGAVPYLAGGIAGAVGANDTADKLFGAYEKARNIADVEQGPAPTSTAGRITQAVAGLPVGIATLGAASMPEAGAQVIRQGGTIQEALGQTALDTGANAAGLALGGLGKSVASRVAGQGIAFGALGQASRAAGNAMRGPDQQEAFDPVQLGIDVGTGAGFGLLPHGHEATVTPPPAPELRGITHQPDFVTDAAGRTINNKGDQTLGQPVTGGPGMDQQGPGGPPPPAIPPAAPPAPLQLTHEPDVVNVDSQGKAQVTKGVLPPAVTEVGGEGLDQPFPLAQPPKGPISAALDTAIKPPEAPAPQPEAPSGAAATPSLRDSYAARQSQIDALNSARKSDGLDDDSLNKLHDLRDVQDGHDALTGLLNQKGYDDAVASGQYTHAAALDLDQFKPINDTFGHKAGDAVLQHVAQILHDSSAGDVTVARIHGDEYAGLAKGDPTQAMSAAQKTLRESPFDIDYVDKDGNPHTHTFDGIGITYGVGKDYETADAAANAAKPKTGRRNTDTDTRSVRSEDVQAAAGGEGEGASGGRQDDLQGAAREPATIKTSVGDVTVDHTHDIPLLGSSSKDGTVHIDKDFDPVIKDGPLKGLDRTPFLVEHEAVEAKAEKDGQNYSQSHYDHAEPAEHKMLLEHLGLKEGTPEADKAIEAYEASYKDDLKAAAAKKNPQVPPDLITKPYDHAHTEAQRRMMDEVDAQQTTAEEPVIASRNATQPSRRGVPKETVATALKEPISKLSGDAPKIFIHQSHEEAPPNLRNSKGFDRSVKGAFDPNTNSVHIFSDSIHTPREAQEVLTHEIVGHYGLEKIIGKDWPKLVNDLNLHRDKPSAAMRDVIKEVDQRYPGADRDTFASEAMAIMAERGVRNTFTDRVMAAVRKFVRSLGINAKFSDAELRQMLVAAKRRVESDPTTTTPNDEGSTPKFSKVATGAKEEKPPESFLDKATGIFKADKAELASRAIKQVALQGRDLARGVARAAWAARDRAVGTADAAIDAFRSHFDARPKDVRGDPSKAYADVIAYQQKKPIADPVAKKFIDTMAGMLDKQASAIRAFGEDKLGLLDQYFPQLWKDPGRAEKMYADMQAKRPLAGSKGFTKERVFEDYEAGIKAGMEPAFDNPADALMARYQSGERYLAALKIKNGINTLGMLKDIGQGDRVPVGFARVHDNTFAGKVVPEMVARDLNNYLAPGLSQFKAWRNFRWLQNVLLSARLGFSAFHAGFTTVDSAMTHLDLGFRKALSGDISGALRHMGQIPLTPIHAIQGLAGKGEGAKLVRQFYGKEAADPQTAAVLDALTQGGARGRMDPTDYNNDFAQQLRAWKTDGIQGLMKTPLKNIGAVLEAAMRPIASNLVPAQKMTARVELMRHELDRVAQQLGQKKGDYDAITKAMNPDALKQIAHSVVSRVDDRLGQVAYDNLFWNRTVKDLLQASIQSVGWNLGTKNVIFGGLADARKLFKPESLLAPLDKEGTITDATMSRVTGRLSYLIALNVGIGTLGAMTQYMLTGQGPQELKDYFFPKTGNKNPDGTDARISFPSYVKDEFGFARHPIDTVEHKLHPSFSMIAELLNNKDFYGNQIVNPDDPWTKVAGQVASYVGKGFVPYAVQNQNNIEQAGGGIAARVAPFVGVTPAPGSETHSQAQSYIADRYYAAHPSEGKTPEAAAHSKEFSASINAIRQGQTPDLSSFTPAERQKIVKYAHEDPATLVEKHFAKLPLSQQLTAYDKATEAERAQYKMKIAINRGASKALQNESDPEVRSRLQERLGALRGQ